MIFERRSELGFTGLPIFFFFVIQKVFDLTYDIKWYPVNTMANNLPLSKKALAISALAEGSCIRSIERMTGVHRDTIMRLGVRVGQACKEIHDETMKDLDCADVQVDEISGFIGAKQKTAKRKTIDPEYGEPGRSSLWTGTRS